MTTSRFSAALLFASLAGLAQAQSKGKVDFEHEIAPVLVDQCLRCHHNAGAADFTTREKLLAQHLIVPGKPDQSPLYMTVEAGSMPPGQKLPADQIAAIRRWISQGASWPSGVVLEAKAEPKPSAAQAAAGNEAEMGEVAKVRERILANHANAVGTKTYHVTLPNTTVSYDMVEIPAGEFTMGSDAQKDESPTHKVKVSGFWMQAHEVTWDEYRLFMFANQAGEVAHKDETVDGVSRPTRPYVEMSFGMGINGFPAISMTQHAANKYAEWLSAKTGEFYRLPTEAEWEYACRAGSTSEPTPLADYAWFAADSSGKYQKVATKKPNQWGLFDMLGNVMEWTLDQYEPYKAESETDPVVWPKQPYPIAVRGGSWNDPASSVSCTVRVGSDASWKQQDPQLPKSIWYETDAQWLGFRLIRPAKVPDAAEMYHAWNNGVEHDEQ